MNLMNLNKYMDNMQISLFANSAQEITEREKSIIKFIGEGNTNIQIAEQLSLSFDRIVELIENLLSKTNTKNVAHLMLYAAVNKIAQNVFVG